MLGRVTGHCVVGSYVAGFILLGDFRFIDNVIGFYLGGLEVTS